MDARLRAIATEARGFMPPDEGLALYAAGIAAGELGHLLEVGTYCGKSTVYLGAAAQARGRRLITVDHHHGSEEHQPGWEYHEPDLVDPVTGRIDTLPTFRRTLHRAGLEDVVVALVGSSATAAGLWGSPVALVFIDGGHTDAAAEQDYQGWTPHLLPGGLLVIHDVFPDPADGGQAPYRIYRRALDSGEFTESAADGTGSLRVLRKNPVAVGDVRPSVP
ncbi:class I SAM-dependent methyltransferase [Actinoplanes sp. NPDC048967]|uniref:class I SAM-dependent methyltransferase n=1 Tax=Actinoplanes sp. NPDC048967 TaxID=3155269 RepID=UPI0033D5B4E1